VSFELEGGPDLEIFSPDDRRLFFSALLAAQDAAEGPEEQAAGLGRLAAAAARRRASVLSFDGRGFNLHLALDLKEASQEKIVTACRAFLNDWDWWRQKMPGLESPPATGPGPWFTP
jgi:hypothetical protein